MLSRIKDMNNINDSISQHKGKEKDNSVFFISRNLVYDRLKILFILFYLCLAGLCTSGCLLSLGVANDMLI